MHLFVEKLPKIKLRPSAQGMVEFALVLPILLLVMLGIFAFGHLLFSYTLVTAASREAARYGIATGLSDSNLPRFRDCNAIRAAAVRIGSFAGVSPDNITIKYDKGPYLNGDPADFYTAADVDDCPIDGVGPGYIQIGDRIVIIIDVNYRPITPLAVIPSLNLIGETRRTIIRTLPIGDAPVAPGSKCVGTITRIIPPVGLLSSTSKVGETYTFNTEVIADDPSITAPGTLRIYVDDPTYTTAAATGTTPSLSHSETWFEIGAHKIRSEYDPGGNATTDPCYNTSRAEPWDHIVEPADTEIVTFTVERGHPFYSGNSAKITVEVRALAPGGGIPVGPVVLTSILDDGTEDILGIIPVTSVTGFPGVARGSTNLIIIGGIKGLTVRAVYDPGDPGVNPNYNESPPVFYGVEIDPTPTPIPTPTDTPVPTETPTDEPTPTPTEELKQLPTPLETDDPET